MLTLVPLALLVLAYAGAGFYNLIGSEAARDTFLRLGYPAWWCRVTGVLEIVSAVLLVIPATRTGGLILGGLIVVVAALSVLRRREFSHLAPLGIFLVLTAVVAALR